MTLALAIIATAAIGAALLVLLRRRFLARRARSEGNEYLRHLTEQNARRRAELLDEAYRIR